MKTVYVETPEKLKMFYDTVNNTKYPFLYVYANDEQKLSWLDKISCIIVICDDICFFISINHADVICVFKGFFIDNSMDNIVKFSNSIKTKLYTVTKLFSIYCKIPPDKTIDIINCDLKNKKYSDVFFETDINIVPSWKLIDNVKSIYQSIKSELPKYQYDNFFDSIYMSMLVYLQSQKPPIDYNEIAKYGYTLDAGDTISYNPYTITRRATARIGNLLLSSLSNSSGIRKAISIPAHTLISIDFEAFHFRLLAKYFKLELPTTSVHEYFAKIYFNTENITPELYAQSKQKSFSFLYGDCSNTRIELFDRIHELKKRLIEEDVPTYFNRYVSKDVEDYKKFNYFIQMLETEETIRLLYQFFPHGRNAYKIESLLYLYDSFIIFPKEDFVQLRPVIHKINKEYPVKIKKGANYQELENFSDFFIR